MPQILSILDSTNASSGFIRPVREGEQVLNSGLIISVGVKNKEGNVLHVQALVLRSSGITTQHPYLVEVWIDLTKEYGSRVYRNKSIECECKAGESAKCKHVIAVLLYLARVEEHELEDLTCTDIEQQWGALKASTLAEYEAKELRDLCHVQAQKNVYASSIPPINQELKKKWENRLVLSKHKLLASKNQSNPSGEYAIFFSTMRKGEGLVAGNSSARVERRYSSEIIRNLLTARPHDVLLQLHNLTKDKVLSLDPELRQFYEDHVQVSFDQSAVIASIVQGTNAWLSERCKRLTASKARSQYTCYVNPKASWDKRYQDLFHSSFSGNEDTIRGLRCEGPAREAYAESTGTKVFEIGQLTQPELPWLGASLDGVVVDGQGKIVITLEIKSPKEGTRLDAAHLRETKCVKTLDEKGQLKESCDHYGQVQLGMLLSGLSECDYVVYSEKGNDFIPVRVPLNPPYVLDLVSRLVSIYFDIFLPKIKLEFDP